MNFRRAKGNVSFLKISVTLASILMLTCISATKVNAGVKPLSCQEPTITDDADVTILVLPYKYSGSSEHTNPTLNHIPHLIKMNLLLSTERLKKIEIVQLENDLNGRCDHNLVLEKLNSRKIKKNHGIVLFWGDIFTKGEKGEKIEIQHHLRFLRKGVSESLIIKIGGHDFKGVLPSDLVSFRKREITKKQIETIKKLSSRPFIIYDQPHESASEADFSKRTHQSSSYVRDGIFKNWVHIKSSSPDLSGWILPAADGNKSLQNIFPELFFLEGSVAYLLGTQIDKGTPPNLHSIKTSKMAFKTYEDELSDNGDDFVRSTALTFRAALDIIDYGDPKIRFNNAHTNLKKALALTPSSSNIINLETVTKLHNEYLNSDGHLSKAKQGEISLGFAKARELDLNNSEANNNNLSFQKLLKHTNDKQLLHSKEYSADKLDIFENKRQQQWIKNIAVPDCRYYSPYNTNPDNALREKEFALFPSGDLFRPLLADPKEIRFALGTLMRVKPENADSFNGQTISIGGEWQFARLQLRKNGPCNGIQINFHAALFSLYKHRDKAVGIIDVDLLNSDYTFGSSITFRDKNFSSRLRFSSLNSNLNNESALGKPQTETQVGFRELELLTAYDLHLHRRNDLRIFGGMAYLFRRNPDDQLKKFHYGLEVRHLLHFFIPQKSFLNGRYPIYVVLGSDFKRFEQYNYNVDRSITAGVEVYNVLSENRWRILFRYFDGFNPYGNFYEQKLKLKSLELSIEF